MRNHLPLLVLILVILPFDTSPVHAYTKESDTYTTEEAAEIARAHLLSERSIIPEWDSATLSQPVFHYDLSGEVSAFVFSVIKDDLDLGYITISAQKLPNPVLEFSTSPAHHKKFGPQAMAFVRSQGLAANPQKPLYLGPLSYYYRIEDSPPVQLIAMNGLRMETLPEGLLEVVHDEAINQNFTERPETVEINPSSLQISTPSLEPSGKVVKILRGPDYSWYLGCAPTAAGNVMGFWSDRGYPNLVYDGSQGDYEGTIQKLALLMDTNWYGWTFFPIYEDLQKFAAQRGYSFRSDEWRWPPFSMLMEEIDGYRPAVLLLSAHYLYGSHFVTLFGYEYDPNDPNYRYMIIHDTYDHGDYRIIFGWGYYDFYIDTIVPPVVTPDRSAPNSSVLPLSPYQVNKTFTVKWSGIDQGWGIQGYDIQYRDGLSGEWKDWIRKTTSTSASFTGTTGHTYFFRSRAIDIDGNQEAYPLQADALTAVVTVTASGRVVGNRGQPVVNAAVTASPSAVCPVFSSFLGAYQLGFLTSGIYSISATAGPSFGTLPPMKNISLSSSATDLNLVLPPAGDLFVNGNFESDLHGWTLSGSSPPVLTSSAYTGDYALQLGAGEPQTTPQSSQACQTVSTFSTLLASDESPPILSFLYRPAVYPPPAGDFSLMLQATTQIVTQTLPLTISGWKHAWFELSEMPAETLQVCFQANSNSTTSALAVYLDAVSLGPAHKAHDLTWLPIIEQ